MKSENERTISFRLPNSAIHPRADLSISRYKQIEHKEIEYEKPGVIMEKVMALEQEIAKDVDEIRAMIGKP